MTADLTAPYFASSPDAGLTLLSRRFWDAATQAEQRAAALRSAARSAGLERIQERFVECRRAASHGGDSCFTAAAATKEASRAYAAFLRGAPTPDEIAAARADSADAVEAVRQAALADQPTAALCEIRDAADRHLKDLQHRREQAIAELERALNRVLERLRSARRGRQDHERGGGRAIPGTPPPSGGTPPRGPINVPGPPTPGLNPRPAPPAIPPSTNISSIGPGTDTLAQLLSAAAKPQSVQPTMPMQQPPMQMPQMPTVPQPAAAPAPAGSRDRKRGPIDEAIDDLLGDEDRDTAAPGLAAAAVTPAPRPAPAGSIAPPAPTVPPVSGTSADGLTTRADPSGRPTPPAGAFAAPPTSLSGSHTAQATMAGTTPGAAPAAHPGGAPMGAPMGGMPGAGAGGGSGSSRPPVLKHQGLDHGQSAQAEAVDGYGTIAKRRDRDDLPRRR